MNDRRGGRPRASEKAPPARILCVDDDANILSGFRRTLGSEFDLVTAIDPVAALLQLEKDPAIEVVLCDMKMPGIDGISFLTRAKRILPAASRVMLTGAPNLDCAVAAINEGAIFRFLTKPCPQHLLLGTLQAAVDQHRAAHGERRAAALPSAPAQPTWRQQPAASETPRPSAARGLLPAHGLRVPETGAIRAGCLMAAVAAEAEQALARGGADDAERILMPPLQLLLKQAQSGKPTDTDDVEMAAVFAARLAGATCKGTWIDYVFRLFSAVRRLLPNSAIDELHAALCHARGASAGPIQLYISILEFHGRSYGPAERRLLRRIHRCRALMLMGSNV